MDYGVGISNRYAFLDDDVEDNLNILETAVKEKPTSAEKKKDPKLTKTKNSAQGQKSKKKEDPNPKVVAETETSVRGRGGATNRGGRGAGPGRGGVTRSTDDDRNKENFETREPGRGQLSARGSRGHGHVGHNGVEKRNFDEDDYSNVFNTRHHGGATEFSTRGSRGSRGAGRGGFTRRREFDRASGSDRSTVKPVDKREGAGAHNWGTYRDEYDDNAGIQIDNNNEKTETEEIEMESGQGDAHLNGQTDNIDVEMINQETEKQIEEPEPQLLTLGQWKAMQQPRTTPEFNIRKPNEGEDPSKWKNLVLKKKENLDDEDEYEGEDIWVPQRAGRQKLITDIGFHFEHTKNDRGYRRGGFKKRSDDDGKPIDAETETDSAGTAVNGSAGTGTYRGRGGRGGGYGRGFKRDQLAKFQRIPRVDDINDFPSLGVC